MRTYPFRTPYLLTQVFSGLTWKADSPKEKTLYLTFDDGPDPEVTPYVIELLDAYDAKATFFVVGANAKQFPEVLQLTQSKGHAIGNHTFHHHSGWRTSNAKYFQDIDLCNDTIAEVLGENSGNLFRPPYGRIKPAQARTLKKQHNVVMWSLLSGDFDKKLNLEVSKRALGKSKSGDIIVFHDSQKSLPNLKQLLPWFLECFHRKGYKFAALSPLK